MSAKDWIRVLLNPRQWKSVLSWLVVVKVHMKSRVSLAQCRRCAGNVRNLMSSQILRAAVARAAVKAAKAAATSASAIAVDKSAIEDPIVVRGQCEDKLVELTAFVATRAVRSLFLATKLASVGSEEHVVSVDRLEKSG